MRKKVMKCVKIKRRTYFIFDSPAITSTGVPGIFHGLILTLF